MSEVVLMTGGRCNRAELKSRPFRLSSLRERLSNGTVLSRGTEKAEFS